LSHSATVPSSMVRPSIGMVTDTEGINTKSAVHKRAGGGHEVIHLRQRG
jgi:hypothetical protein